MGKMIYTGGGAKKHDKKKPGWQAAQQQEAEWLAGINSMKAFSTSKWKGAKKAAPSPVVGVVKRQVIDGVVVQSVPMGVGGGTKKVIRPEIEYKGNEELIERERIARERKFNIAPAYNKGGDVFVTEEELANQLRGNKRRG